MFSPEIGGPACGVPVKGGIGTDRAELNGSFDPIGDARRWPARRAGPGGPARPSLSPLAVARDLLDPPRDPAELAACALAKEGVGGAPDDRDHGHERGVLHE